jgi:hypothetical protein
MIKAMFFLMILLVPHLSFTFAGTIDPSTPDSKYIEYGKSFTYIGQLSGTNSEGNLFLASSVAIDDHNILTAAHVIKDIKTCNIKINNKIFEIKEFTYPKEFDAKNSFGYYDIALGHISEKIGLDWYPSLYESDDETGKICCISGYGYTGTFNTGAYKADNKLRAGSNVIDYIDRQLLICSPTLGKGKTSLEFIIAAGDSGGGLFIDNKLAGINSCVLSIKQVPTSNYATESGHTRISKHLEWIKKNWKK